MPLTIAPHPTTPDIPNNYFVFQRTGGVVTVFGDINGYSDLAAAQAAAAAGTFSAGDFIYIHHLVERWTVTNSVAFVQQ